MRILGLTGGMGSGKSTVGRMLAALGAELVDTDQLAREAVLPGTPALAALVAEFGREVLLPDGSLDRRRLAEVAFRDPTHTERLNAITHPEVRRLFRERMSVLAAAGAEVVVVEVPLLYEVGFDQLVESVIVVTTDDTTQAARLAAAGFSLEDARRRIAAQMPLSEKVARAGHVIDNSGDLTATESQVRELWERLTSG
ncbi:MAG: dephospho-CoA kinase [Candidatus Dormibacteria bacterium]